MDPGILTNISVIYPKIQHKETGCISLQPLVLTVCFSGMLPEGLLQENIMSRFPIQVSVSIDKEYGIFTTPVVNTVSMDMRDSDSWQADPLPTSDMADCSFAPPPDDRIPFLLLPPTFNSHNREDWKSLSKEIETWLVLEVDPQSLLWTWGRDTFWLAFIGAYLHLPRGRWLKWDSRVPLQGTFIEAWLDQFGVEGNWIGMRGTNEVLDHIWTEFCMHAAPFYPSPLISSDCLQDDQACGSYVSVC
ncbi:hypothetical protein F4604DRAFT_1578553 [Suillus subluteus]|nr:hypothetical protein F4604DRAFT_1578553 [Suillus subluteus]